MLDPSRGKYTQRKRKSPHAISPAAENKSNQLVESLRGKKKRKLKPATQKEN